MITRRDIFPSLVAVTTTGALANAQINTYKKPKEEECKCECEGKVGPPGPKGEKGDKGDSGICECKHESRSLHVDFEIVINGFKLPTPDIIVSSPNSGKTGLMDELWYYKGWNACVFFDYSKPIPEYIIFWRGGEATTYWDTVNPVGIRVWNWIIKGHACIVSLDKILSKPEKIIQNWMPITNSITFGSF